MNTKHKIHDTFNEISKKLKRNDAKPKTYRKLIDHIYISKYGNYHNSKKDSLQTT